MKIFSYIFFSLFLFSGSPNTEGWRLKKDKDAIKIYTRGVEESAFKEFMATSIFQTNFDAILYELYEAPKYENQSEFGVSYRIHTQEENTRYFYYKEKMPWPLKNRDVVIELMLEEESETHRLLSIKATPELLEKLPNTIRVEELSGFWLLKKHPEGIEATQQIFMNPGGKIPAFIVNPLLVKGPLKTFKDLQTKLNKD